MKTPHPFRTLAPFTWHNVIVLALAGALLTSLAALTAGCGSSSPQAAADTVDNSPVTVKAKGPVSKDAVQQILDRKLGDAGIAGQPVIRDIQLIPENGGTFVDISINRTASCHPGQLVTTADDVTKQVMSSVFLYSDVNRIQLSLYGTTEDAADKDKLAAQIMITKADSAKIDWFQFSDQNAAQLATKYWIEPTIYANWLAYGGAPITDPQQLAAANAAKASAGGAAATPASP